LRHFYASFPLVKSHKNKQKSWITTGIKISCRNKRILYAEVKKSTNPVITNYYKNYCRILTRVISLAKKMAYDKQIMYSKNKARSTWKIINSEIQNRGKMKRYKHLTAMA
jgi:hypothetical protein